MEAHMSNADVYVARKGRAAALRAAAAARSGYSIVVRFEGGLTENQKDAFKRAADRWTRVIVGDLPAVIVDGEVIDDLLIIASGVAIDGVGRILGRAGPTRLRPINAGAAAGLPATGIMEFDTDDLANMEEDGSLGDVIAHEMGHVIGVGTIWERKSRLAGAGTSDPAFTGPGAMKEYADLRDTTNLVRVPVENRGGPGTADSHWRDSTFGNELMTGFVAQAGNPLSRMTVASLGDLGYTVDLEAAEPYSLPLPNALVARSAAGLQERHKRGGVIHYTEPVELPPESLVGS
jgi:hypothetical protein